MNPLTGISTFCGNALGYRYASPAGDEGRNNQHLGAHLVSAAMLPQLGYNTHILFTATPPQCDGATTTLHSPFLILNWSHTFSAKERDAETGLSYFGARYYSSDLSIWLSVDPMSDKYPSFSPYVYCADNPVKLVDPNGEDVWITGDEWELAFKQLKSSTNLKLSRDSKTGKISYSGEVKTESDAKLQEALDDNNVHVRISANDIDDIQGISFEGGAHMGTKINPDGSVDAKQTVNPLLLSMGIWRFSHHRMV